MSKAIQNPYRVGSMNHKVVSVLLRAKGALDAGEIAKRARIPLGKTAQVLAALRNPFHNATARRAGLSLEIEGDGFVARQVEPDPNARRPSKKDK